MGGWVSVLDFSLPMVHQLTWDCGCLHGRRKVVGLLGCRGGMLFPAFAYIGGVGSSRHSEFYVD